MTEPYSVAVIPGDLNGITVTNAALAVADAARPFLTRPLVHTQLPYGADYFLERGITQLGPAELEELARHDQIFLGAIGDPTKIKPGVLEIGILLKVRQAFDQYVNLRPVVLPQGVPSVLVGKGPEEINFEICRENSEGLYVGIGRVENAGTEDEVGIQEMHCSYRGVKRLAEFAEQRARARKRRETPTIHFVFKTNVLTYASSPWLKVFEEFQGKPDLSVKYMHVDNFGMQMLTHPEQFDVVVIENMFGDIMTDIGAVLQGGIGTAVSGNINPTGAYPSMFEPVHGTAPDKWYEKRDGMWVHNPELMQQMRPEAAILAYAMMLEQMGEVRAAEKMTQAALANIRNPGYGQMPLDTLVENACRALEREAA